MDVARLLVEVDANTAAAEAGLARLHKQVAIAAIGFGVIGLAAIAAGVIATKMAGDYQAGIATIITGAGEQAKNMGFWTKNIKDLAVETGTSTQQLIAGAFMVNSANYHTTQGLNILRDAAEGAKVGHADLGVTADAVTTIMKDYANVLYGAAGATNFLIGLVANGKTHLEDVAQSLAMVLPTAAAAKVPLLDVGAAMATMTGEGVPAANAATYLRQTIISLMAPGAGAKNMLNEIGLSSKQVSDEMKVSLPGTIQMINNALVKKFGAGTAAYLEGVKAITGGSKTMQGFLDLSGTHAVDFAANVGKIGEAMKKGGKSILGWNLIQGDFNVQISKLREEMETAFITIGEKLLPVLTKVTKFIVDNAGPAVKGLTKFWKDHQGIITIVAILIGGALVASFVAWTVSAAAAAVATIAATWPILLAGAAIAGLIALLIYAYKNWWWFRLAINNAVDGLKLGITWIGWLIGKLGDLLGVLGHVKDAIGNVFGSLGNLIGKISSVHIPGFASGTTNSPDMFYAAEKGPELLLTPGIYTAPRGSTILNAQDTARAMQHGAPDRMGGGGGQTTYNIYPAKSCFDADDMDRLQRRRALLSSRGGGYG